MIPLSSFEGGNDGAAYIELCTGSDGHGSCVTKEAYFRLPED